MKLDGNTILITGGSSGIGFEFARAFVALRNTVIITGRDVAKLTKAQAQVPELKTIRSDVSRVEDINALYVKVTHDFPALNVLMNNAGVMRPINFHKDGDDLDDLTSEIDINLKGYVRMTRRFLLHLKEQPAAAIINITSALAFVPLPLVPVYCATKAGLHSFTQSLRVQLARTKVQVFEVAPPATQTDMLGPLEAADLKGISTMPVADMVQASLRGLKRGTPEIRPGQSKLLWFMNRVAPNFILAQLAKPAQRMQH
jgi:uncharacterized oxidoreductase